MAGQQSTPKKSPQPDDRDELELRLEQMETRILHSIDTARATLSSDFKREIDNATRQIEALTWLHGTLAFDAPLPVTRGWAASPDILVELVRLIAERPPSVAVELGSGVSTLVIAAAMRRYGGGEFYAIEHDDEYAAGTQATLDAQGLANFTKVVIAPLGPVDIDGRTWRWYQIPDDSIPQQIDLLFVDGPPGPTGYLARYPALPILGSSLSPGGVVLADDTNRDDEREIVSRWLAEDVDWRGSELKTEKGAWILFR